MFYFCIDDVRLVLSNFIFIINVNRVFAVEL